MRTPIILNMTASILRQTCCTNSLPFGPRVARPLTTSAAMQRAAPAPVGAGFLKGKKAGPTLEKVKLAVETDPHRLVNFVCNADIRKEDPQDPEIKADSEYPDWLWNIRRGRAPPLEEMEPGSKNYWRRTKAYFRRYRKELKKSRKF